jgi:DNA-binding beta-propeller fold protein YncE
MKHNLRVALFTLSAYGAIAILAACGGTSGAFGPAVSPAVGARTPVFDQHGRSWMSPDAKKAKALLYVTDGNDNDAYVYSWPKRKLVGTLTYLNDPNGMCVDAKGDVYITENYGQQIVEYAHGGSTPIATLSDPGWQPDGCSVDPATGNVAVANIVTTEFTQGSLAIYKKGSTSPTYYTPPGGSPGWFSVNAVGYDNKSNAFFAGSDGFEGGPNFEAGELPSGGSSTKDISLNESIANPGQVQWDGKYITYADSDSGTVYRFTISGSTGTEVGATTVKGCCSGNVWYSWIAGKTLIEAQTGGVVAFYKYPAGGNATKTMSLDEANSAVFSVKKKK